METGGAEGSYSFARYGEWLNKKTDFVHPQALPAEPALEPAAPLKVAALKPKPKPVVASDDGALVIGEEEDPLAVLTELERRGR